MTYTTHTTLLTRLSEGIDPAAWKEFHDRYLELIKGFGRQCGLQPADCDDAAQEVFLALSKSMSDFSYDPEKGRFRSYLKTVSLRIIFRILRQKQDQKPLNDLERIDKSAFTDSEVEEMWETEWRQYHMRQALGRIESEFNEKDRLAFSLYVLKNRPAEETAKKLGLSLDQVYQAKSRIIKSLSQMITEQIKDEG
jgi:RNA polymerase sigma-70 factor (ECF subfamily)